MNKYRGFEVKVTPKGYEIFNEGKSTGTVCDSRSLTMRVIDDRIRSGRWKEKEDVREVTKMVGEQLPGQMDIMDLLGGDA